MTIFGPNIWPEPERRQTKVVARLIALALDLDGHIFYRQEMLGEAMATLRLLHYGPISEPGKGIFRAGAHSDFGFITLLATDEVPGLQICKDRDVKPQVWEHVSPIKGAFIVNLGDLLERWSNCTFRSTLHRVVGNGQNRYSIAFLIVLLSACQPANQKKTLPSFPKSCVRLI